MKKSHKGLILIIVDFLLGFLAGSLCFRGCGSSDTQKDSEIQQETVQELQSSNDDVDLSDIVLKYTAAYTAYQSSLTAAGRLGSVNLLNYI